MLRPVWPGFRFWKFEMEFAAMSSIYLYVCLNLGIFSKLSAKLAVLYFSVICLVIVKTTPYVENIHDKFLKDQEREHFCGYRRLSKAVGASILLFGNVALYYFSAETDLGIYFFLSLSLFSLGTLFLIQPNTDFGVIEFCLSASLNEALRLFGILNVQTWIVAIVCLLVVGVRYWLEPDPETEPMPPPPEPLASSFYADQYYGY